jgi:hypothetical protein
MATIYATQSGNWSSTSTWVGGVLPTTGDDVFSNNKTITIDQDISVQTLRNLSNTTPAITAGGGFVISSVTGTRNITLTGANTVGYTSAGIWGSGANVLTISATSSATINLTYPTGQPQVNISSGSLITGNATINYVGTMNQNASFSPVFNIQNTAAGGTMNVVGNPIGSGVEAAGILVSAAGYTLNITGNLIGGGGAGNGNPSAVRLSAASTLNVTGNVTAAGAAGYGIECAIAGSTINVTGNVTAAAVNGIIFSTNNTLTVNGNVTSSSAASGISNTNTSATITVNGNLTNVSDYMAVSSPKLRISPTTSQTWTIQTAGTNRQMLTTNAFTNYPAVSDVRFGVTYSNSGSLTGTSYIPVASSVAFGVPTGPTATGTSILTRAQLLADFGALLAAYNA